MKVAVFGLGYVGAVTAACLASKGHDVWGVDVDPGKVAMIEDGISPVAEPGLTELVSEVVGLGRLRATTSAVLALDESDVSLVCVGTPSTPDGRADLSYVHRVMDDIARTLAVCPPRSGFHAVVVRSTVPPGTVEVCRRLLTSGLTGAAVEVGIAMCPEFLREGTGIADFYAPPYTVIGAEDPAVIASVRSMMSFLSAPVRIVDIQTAEALKYACNAFHATKVSFANELGRVFRRLGVDSREVMDLFCEDHQLNISTRYLRPGFAFGGSCLPKDLRSLLHIGRMESLDLPLLAGTLETNRRCVDEVIERVIEGPGRTVALLGLSFKPDSDDLRESPYVDVAERLLGKGFDVRIYDPIVNPATLVGTNRQYVESKLPHLRRILAESPGEALEGADTAIVSCSWPAVIGAILANPPARIIDLDGRLGAVVEATPGYQGVSW